MSKRLLCTISFSKASNAKMYSYYTNIEDLKKRRTCYGSCQ